MALRVNFDWVEAAPSTDVLAQATMAALTIDVDGCVVTSVLDRRSRSSRNHVVTPLAGVAEWLAGNWWRLFHEIEDRTMLRPDFAAAHDLSLVGDGYLLPCLTIAPTPERMRLRWWRHQPAYSAIEFTEQGEALVDRDELEGAFCSLVDAVLDRLGDQPGAAFLRDEWSAIQGRDEDEREFCRAAALLGQDPFATPPALADQIIDFWNRTASPLREDALATAGGASLASLADWLKRTMQDVDDLDGSGWHDFRQALPRPAAQAPYARGYDMARAARAQLQPRSLRYDFATTGTEALPAVAVHPPGGGIRGLVATQSPACAVAHGHESSRRFLLARALGDYLGRTADAPAILSGLATDRQAQSRAFAAEFLVPAESLRRKLGAEQVAPDAVDDLALEYGVSAYVVRHQIENHGLAQIADW